jgi:tRNA-binding EMAP/Myf-like protein
MNIGDPVWVNDLKGRILWIDNPWKSNKDADLLCKITFENQEGFKLHRISELKPREEDIKEKVMDIQGKEKIEFTEFLEIEKKLEIKVGKVTAVEDVPKSNKLIKLTVDFGTETRTVVTSIKPLLNPTDDTVIANLRTSLGFAMSIVDKSFAFITNLKPVTMMGIESTAMILPGEIELGKAITINGLVNPGTKLI